MIALCIWAAVAFTIYFQEFVKGHRVKLGRWRPLNRKPFSCEKCLPFWIVAVIAPTAIYLPQAVPFIAITAAACTAGILGALLTILIQRL